MPSYVCTAKHGGEQDRRWKAVRDPALFFAVVVSHKSK